METYRYWVRLKYVPGFIYIYYYSYTKIYQSRSLRLRCSKALAYRKIRNDSFSEKVFATIIFDKVN